MEVLILEDSASFIEALKKRSLESGITETRVTPLDCTASPYEICREINELAYFAEAILCIKINLLYSGGKRQEQPGIEIIRLLRLVDYFGWKNNKARDIHCILYSFAGVEVLLRQKPENLILCSEGITFVQLPVDFSHLDLKELAKKKAKIESLSPFFRVDFTLPDERHDWANWWGIKQLWDVHKLVIGDSKLKYPTKIHSKFAQANTHQAFYLYGTNQKVLENTCSKFKHEIKNLRNEILERKIKVLHIDDEWDDGWSEILINMFYDSTHLPKISKTARDPSYPFANFHINGQSVFRALKISKRPEIEQLSSESKVTVAYEQIQKLLSEPRFDADLILLDLRLFSSEKGAYLDAKRLSGARILDKLRDDFKSIPVIITTASNKAWSFEQVLQLGADGYWIKEGLDERRDAEMTLRNYLRLLQIVETATGEEYQFLKRFVRAIDELFDKGSLLWWQGKISWPKGQVSAQPRQNDIRNALDSAALMLRAYLSHFKMSFGNEEKANAIFWLTAVIQNLGNVLEEIHRLDMLPQNERNSGTIGWKRDDYFGVRLYEIRNEASHQPGIHGIDWHKMKHFMASLLCYLAYGPKDVFLKNMKLDQMIEKCKKTYSKLYFKIYGG